MNKKIIYKILFVFLFSLIIYFGFISSSYAGLYNNGSESGNPYGNHYNPGKGAGFLLVVEKADGELIIIEKFGKDSITGIHNYDCTNEIEIQAYTDTEFLFLAFDDALDGTKEFTYNGWQDFYLPIAAKRCEDFRVIDYIGTWTNFKPNYDHEIYNGEYTYTLTYKLGVYADYTCTVNIKITIKPPDYMNYYNDKVKEGIESSIVKDAVFGDYYQDIVKNMQIKVNSEGKTLNVSGSEKSITDVDVVRPLYNNCDDDVIIQPVVLEDYEIKKYTYNGLEHDGIKYTILTIKLIYDEELDGHKSILESKNFESVFFEEAKVMVECMGEEGVIEKEIDEDHLFDLVNENYNAGIRT